MKIPISSTHLSEADYDEATRELTITFADGATYTYDEVPEEVAIGLGNTISVGKYFRENIRERYRYNRK